MFPSGFICHRARKGGARTLVWCGPLGSRPLASYGPRGGSPEGARAPKGPTHQGALIRDSEARRLLGPVGSREPKEEKTKRLVCAKEVSGEPPSPTSLSYGHTKQECSVPCGKRLDTSHLVSLLTHP